MSQDVMIKKNCVESVEETKKHMLKWCKKRHGIFSWPTDGCGYDQHIAFVAYKNKYYKSSMGSVGFVDFVINYANTQLK